MKVGDLVLVLYETRNYYLVVGEVPHRKHGGEKKLKLLGENGVIREVRYSDIRIIY